MLLPQYWLRQQKLQRTLVNYPIYDPPHKVEERLLPKEMALENFQYFLDVRKQRVDFFMGWLASQFGVEASLEQEGLERTLDWAADYAAVLMPPLDIRETCEVFLGYSQLWKGKYAGANAFFDLSTMLGEAIIQRRPSLRWQLEWSLSDYPHYREGTSKQTQLMLLGTERDIRHSKREKYSGFRRPILASADNAVDYEPVFQMTMSYFLMVSQTVTAEYNLRNMRKPRGLRSDHEKGLRVRLYKAFTRQTAIST